MLGEDKNRPPGGSAARRACDLIASDSGVTVTALGYEELPGGGVAYNLSVLFANGDEAEITVS